MCDFCLHPRFVDKRVGWINPLLFRVKFDISNHVIRGVIDFMWATIHALTGVKQLCRRVQCTAAQLGKQPGGAVRIRAVRVQREHGSLRRLL